MLESFFFGLHPAVCLRQLCGTSGKYFLSYTTEAFAPSGISCASARSRLRPSELASETDCLDRVFRALFTHQFNVDLVIFLTEEDLLPAIATLCNMVRIPRCHDFREFCRNTLFAQKNSIEPHTSKHRATFNAYYLYKLTIHKSSLHAVFSQTSSILAHLPI